MTAFLRRAPRRSRFRCALERAAVKGFLEPLRRVRGADTRLSGSPTLPATVEETYADYLRSERGLSERSVQVYLPFVRDFLGAVAVTASVPISPAALDARIARDFVLDRVRGRPSEYARLLATAVRSVLRFLFLGGQTAADLSVAAPTVRQWCVVKAKSAGEE